MRTDRLTSRVAGVLRLVVYDEEMVGVNKKLETRRALGANTAIEMPDKPERPRKQSVIRSAAWRIPEDPRV